MLIYIFLILGQAFASFSAATKIYDCSRKMAADPINKKSNYTLKEAAEACRDLYAPNLTVGTATVYKGTLHYIEVSWKENKAVKTHKFFFNIKNSSLCSEPSRSTSVKGTWVNLDEIVNNLEFTEVGNSCGNKFGYIRQGEQCVKKCGDNAVLVGRELPFQFLHKDGDIGAIYKDVPVNEKGNITIGQNLIETRCTPCPKPNYPDHKIPGKSINVCVDKHGCEESWTYDPVVYKILKSDPDVAEVLADFANGCIPACEPHQARNAKGDCVSEKSLSCDYLAGLLPQAKQAANNFIALAQSHKIGKCDMNVMQKEAKNWANYIVSQINEDLSSGKCDQSDFLDPIQDRTIAKYLSTRRPDFIKCFGTAEASSRKINQDIYDALVFDIYSKNSGWDID